jgi:N-methylhydantoinase A
MNLSATSNYLCGVDIGGTFTDCVLVDGTGQVVTTKEPSTPHDFSEGMLSAVEAAAEKVNLTLPALCRAITLLSHGTTVGTNTIIQKRGAKVGLITTKGHNDVIHMMRGSRGLTGRDIRQVVHFPESQKPDPIIPKRLIEGVSERVDCFGDVVVPLNEAETEDAVRRLLANGVAAIAVCFLWSFKRPAHEARVKEIVRDLAPKLFVTCSHELVPKWGEYERTTAVALNAYIGPTTSGYIKNVDDRLAELGYGHPLGITQCGGGTISAARAIEAPLLTLDSGPVSGVTGSKYVGDLMGYRNVITTDMGGTSFDVGVIYDGEPAFSYLSIVNQYEYFLPKVDIQTIGSGGGSLAWIDETTGTLRVGPESAGAVPGPVCYGRGGEVPTVTDADLVMGYLNPENFAGGSIQLDTARAQNAIGKLAERLGMGLLECAAGISTIAEFQMADLIRKVTVEKGFDPRDFVLFAFGGAGPAHAAVFARELGVEKVVIPQKETASVWCAFGAASADVLHVYEQVDIMSSPFDPARVSSGLAGLASKARQQLETEGIAAERQQFRFSLDVRHRGQINEVEVDVPSAQLDGIALEKLRNGFHRRYELLYGMGSSLSGARLEIVTFRCRASAETPKPVLARAAKEETTVPDGAKVGVREVYWTQPGRAVTTSVYQGELLRPGNTLAGPVVIETPDTTVVVHPGQSLGVDRFGNFEITLRT